MGVEERPTATSVADRRWVQYPAALILAVLVAVVFATLSAEGSSGVRGRLGGDFVEFHSAGSIVADGDSRELYDPARQEAAQRGLFGDGDTGGGILFAYPAILAAPYAALQTLGYQAAYLSHTTAMLGAAALALWLLRVRLRILGDRRHRLAAAAFALTFFPMFVGITGGQTTALTLLVIAAVWRGLDTDHDALAGLAAGLLMIKPQYGAVVLGLLVLDRRWRTLPGAIGGIALVWVGSALVAGVGWTGRWLDLARSIAEIDGGSNLANEVSWLGLAQSLFGRTAPPATAVGTGLTVVTVLVVGWCLLRRPHLDGLTVAVIVPTMLLIAPHALFYDAGLLLLPLGVLAMTLPFRRRVDVLAVCWLAGLGHVFADRLGTEPVALLVIATWLWAVTTIRSDIRSQPSTRPPATPVDRQRSRSLAADLLELRHVRDLDEWSRGRAASGRSCWESVQALAKAVGRGRRGREGAGCDGSGRLSPHRPEQSEPVPSRPDAGVTHGPTVGDPVLRLQALSSDGCGTTEALWPSAGARPAGAVSTGRCGRQRSSPCCPSWSPLCVPQLRDGCP